MPRSKKDKWCVYILECKDGSLYTGITKDLEKRINQHNRGAGCRYTKYRFPVRMLYNESCFSRPDALKREAEIKSWERNKKLRFIADG
ncbi:MAG: GIY-YIG nuclease family protein [Candidatus Omnitrophota bacterium]|jgi:putative endonuclease|nr:MAG: GIY-YIG nuclease family protein [Candidatus Omnitrophota bacterium]